MIGLNMRLTNQAALTVIACLLSSAVSYAKEWRGVTPGKSTRGDVVRLFNQCSDPEARCEFDSDEGGVFIVFSGASADYFKCGAPLPADTVLQMQVAPKAKLQFSDLRGNETSFKELTPPDPDNFDYQVYLDEESGLLVKTSEGAVHLISYLAAANDRRACPGYYALVESASMHFPRLCSLPLPELSKFTSSGGITVGDERAALDEFAAKLVDEPSAQAYIIAYAGRKSRAGEALARADRAKTYLIVRHGMEDGRIVTMDGGYRETVAVELFTVPAGAVPPSPTPTIEPKDVRATPGRKAKKPTN
ncbi:MAG: hypothetical protein ACJ741_14065 [Pyrinomonadaceae bacterium]